MKRGNIWRLLCALLCAVQLCGCAVVQQTPEGSTAAAPEETEPAEVYRNGYYMAPEDKVYTFSDNAPVFSLENTFYSGSILVELKTQQPADIYYTTDGSEPDQSDMLYDPSEGIYIIRQIRDFPTAHTIKARAYYPDGTSSAVSAHTYFCDKDIDIRFTTAVFVISGDPELLTEGPDGIFYGDNYHERGDETEREVFIESWDADGARMFAQYAGVRIYGGASRGNSIKSMKIYARKSYSSGIGKFDTDIFGTFVADGSGNVVEEYDKLVLRNCGNDFQFGFIRDELNQRLAMQAGYSDYEAVVPAVVYLNGDYYGLFWLHESYCDDYFKNKYPNDQAQGEFVVAEGTDTNKNEEEDGGKEEYAIEYNRIYNMFIQEDLTNDTVYNQLCKYIDVENYLDYFAFNIYINNNDWPQNNYKCYRYVPAEGEKFDGIYDGRWRYLLHDTDFSYHIYGMDEVSADYDNISQILDPQSNRYSPLFTALMHRQDCRSYFMNKLTELADGALSGQNVTETLYEMHVERCTEQDYMYAHMEALRKAGDTSFWSSSATMAENMDMIRAFANDRKEYILRYAEEALSQFE